MEVAHVIIEDDVGEGVYRHPMGSPARELLVRIANKFGGVNSCDVGKRVYRAANGELVWQGAHKDAI
jgi:hypothetical protein